MSLKVKIDSLETLTKVGTQIMTSGRPDKYIAIDTVTALEDFC